MRVVVVAAALWAVSFSFLAIARHDAFESNAFDLGYVTQTLWNTVHGEPFVFTTVDGVPFSPEGTLDVSHLRKPHSLLAFHVEPILLLVAPLFAIWPDPRLLLILQAIALAAGAVSAAALAGRRLRHPAAPVAFGLAYLLSPSIAAPALSDFHAVSLAPLLIFVALYLIETERPWLGFAAALLATATREDTAILMASLGAYLLARQVFTERGLTRGVRPRLDPFDRAGRPGLWLLLVAGAWALASFGLIVPFFNGTISMLIRHEPGIGSVFWHRYAWLGPTPLAALVNAVVDPGRWIDWILQPDVLAYLATLLLSGGVAAIGAPGTLAVALPIVLENAFSSFDWMRSGGAHYSVILVPVLLFAGMEGTRSLGPALDRITSEGREQLRRSLGRSRPGATSPSIPPRHGEGSCQPGSGDPTEGMRPPEGSWRCSDEAPVPSPKLLSPTRGEDGREVVPAPSGGNLPLSERVRARASTGALLALLLIGAAANHLWLGASPLAPGYYWPSPGPRENAVEAIVATIPPAASVSATSAVYPHVASRARAYWFPALNGAAYVAVDAASSTSPIDPAEVKARVDALLAGGSYRIAATAPGFLLLRRATAGEPSGSTAGIPDRFYDFVRAPSLALAGANRGPSVAFGDNVHLDGYRLTDESTQTIFGPSADLTTYWHVAGPVTGNLSFVFYLTRRSDGAIVGRLVDQAPEPVWYPPDRWQPGEEIQMSLSLPRVRDLQAVGVAVVGGSTGARLPIQAAPGAVLWESGTIAQIARLDGR